MRLVLFEIDDTLVRLKGASLAAIVSALQEVYGVTVHADGYALNGKTDPQVAHDLLRRSGLGRELIAAGLGRWADRVPYALRAVLPAYACEACPGVPELLAGLAERDDVLLGLLTGSLESTVALKLAAGGLDVGLFRACAYGSDDDDADRRQLLSTAVMRAEQVLDRVLRSDEVTVVGATPAEIVGARAYGARAIAVATARYTVNELRRYHPTHVCSDLSDVDALRDVLLT
jgi:phosphoglycolate phosphatase